MSSMNKQQSNAKSEVNQRASINKPSSKENNFFNRPTFTTQRVSTDLQRKPCLPNLGNFT